MNIWRTIWGDRFGVLCKVYTYILYTIFCWLEHYLRISDGDTQSCSALLGTSKCFLFGTPRGGSRYHLFSGMHSWYRVSISVKLVWFDRAVPRLQPTLSSEIPKASFFFIPPQSHTVSIPEVASGWGLIQECKRENWKVPSTSDHAVSRSPSTPESFPCSSCSDVSTAFPLGAKALVCGTSAPAHFQSTWTTIECTLPCPAWSAGCSHIILTCLLEDRNAEVAQASYEQQHIHQP